MGSVWCFCAFCPNFFGVFWGDMNFFSVELELCIYMWSVLCFIKAVENLKCNKLSELCKLESSTLYMVVS